MDRICLPRMVSFKLVRTAICWRKRFELTIEICQEYKRRAKELVDKNNLFQVGKRRELTMELQNRCGIPVIWACNILNGLYVIDYVAIIKKQKEMMWKKYR